MISVKERVANYESMLSGNSGHEREAQAADSLSDPLTGDGDALQDPMEKVESSLWSAGAVKGSRSSSLQIGARGGGAAAVRDSRRRRSREARGSAAPQGKAELALYRKLQELEAAKDRLEDLSNNFDELARLTVEEMGEAKDKGSFGVMGFDDDSVPLEVEAHRKLGKEKARLERKVPKMDRELEEKARRFETKKGRVPDFLSRYSSF